MNYRAKRTGKPRAYNIGPVADLSYAEARSKAEAIRGLVDLETLDAQSCPGNGCSRAHAINAQGQVVGISFTASGEQHAFLWEKGTMTDLGTLGGLFSSAATINDSGQVVGHSTTVSGETRAVLWRDEVVVE